jgi:hypothetical protein
MKGLIKLENNLNMFLEDLKVCKRLQLSKQPDIPGEDELIDHQLLSHQIYDTVTGKLMLLKLKNTESGEEYTYCYPDIQDIEINDASTEKHQRYYIKCLDRYRAQLINTIQKNKDMGITPTQSELELLSEGYIITFRITLFR